MNTDTFWGRMASGDREQNLELHDWWFVRFMATAPDDEHEPGPIDYEAFAASWAGEWHRERRSIWRRVIARLFDL